MTTIRKFRAVRPRTDVAQRVAALPYDVMNREEAFSEVSGEPLSFLHVDKAEIDLDLSVDPYDPAVYAKASENLAGLRSEGILKKDEDAAYYIYRLTMDGCAQTGIVACASVDDYLEDRIKKHELTRAEKEADRIRHVDALDANTGPIFLCHRPDMELSDFVCSWAESHTPIFDFVAEDGVRHEGWRVDSTDASAQIESSFARMPALYIADGHHRCASAVRVAQMRRADSPDYTGEEEFNYFLAVLFPSDQLRIFDYNRVVRDLNGMGEEAFLERISESFEAVPSDVAVRPYRAHEFGMFLGNRWYRLTVRHGAWDDADPVACLDVSILQDLLLSPVLGIEDPRTDARIDFIGGIRGLGELERRVSDDMQVAFALYPTTADELMAIADAGRIMPPKSTWFEPKLRSGLFIHDLK